LPDKVLPGFERADYHRVRKEDPHWPLVAMLVLTQLSAGAFLYLSLVAGPRRHGVIAALAVACVSLGASTLHLGRPVHAWRALKMWRRSWLSLEVLLFSLFAAAAVASAAIPAISPVAAVLGFGGVTASAFIYLVPARPAWNRKGTVADFYLTGLLLGPLFLGPLGIVVPAAAVVAAGAAQLLNQLVNLLALAGSDEFELRASARLLTGELRNLLLARIGLLIVGGILLPLLHAPAAAFVLALAGETLSRYLFFVSVVPKSVASTFTGRRAA
jgi:formate dehydrogenase iron-sulfur subunit